MLSGGLSYDGQGIRRRRRQRHSQSAQRERAGAGAAASHVRGAIWAHPARFRESKPVVLPRACLCVSTGCGAMGMCRGCLLGTRLARLHDAHGAELPPPRGPRQAAFLPVRHRCMFRAVAYDACCMLYAPRNVACCMLFTELYVVCCARCIRSSCLPTSTATRSRWPYSTPTNSTCCTQRLRTRARAQWSGAERGRAL